MSIDVRRSEVADLLVAPASISRAGRIWDLEIQSLLLTLPTFQTPYSTIASISCNDSDSSCASNRLPLPYYITNLSNPHGQAQHALLARNFHNHG